MEEDGKKGEEEEEDVGGSPLSFLVILLRQREEENNILKRVGLFICSEVLEQEHSTEQPTEPSNDGKHMNWEEHRERNVYMDCMDYCMYTNTTDHGTALQLERTTEYGMSTAHQFSVNVNCIATFLKTPILSTFI